MELQFAPIYNLIKVLLCLTSLCLCYGAPTKKEVRMSCLAAPRYTDQEIEFIKNDLRSLPSDFMTASEETVWKKLAERIQELRRLGTEGFPQDRTAGAIRRFFRRNLAKDEQFMATLPATVREQLCDLKTNQRHGGNQPYTYEEGKFIVEELSEVPDPYLPIRGLNLWAPIAEKLNSKRGSPGFYAERSPDSLRHYFITGIFRNPNRRVKVPETLFPKFFTAFKRQRQDNGASSSRSKTDLQVANETQHRYELECMIKELQDAPYEVDFSKVDELPSSSFSITDDIRSDLEYLTGYDNWNFEDFHE